MIQGGAPGSQVFIDGETVGTIDPSGALRVGGVDPGEHTVEIRREGFEPKKISRDFPNRSEVTVDGSLKSALGNPKGQRDSEFGPTDADAAADGEASPRPISGRTLNLPPATYTITAEAAGFKPYSATVVVQRDVVKTVALTLESLPKVAPSLVTCCRPSIAWGGPSRRMQGYEPEPVSA